MNKYTDKDSIVPEGQLPKEKITTYDEDWFNQKEDMFLKMFFFKNENMVNNILPPLLLKLAAIYAASCVLYWGCGRVGAPMLLQILILLFSLVSIALSVFFDVYRYFIVRKCRPEKLLNNNMNIVCRTVLLGIGVLFSLLK